MLQAAIEWLKGVYIFGFFSGKEERPPWYLNPLLTFPSIFAIVGETASLSDRSCFDHSGPSSGRICLHSCAQATPDSFATLF